MNKVASEIMEEERFERVARIFIALESASVKARVYLS